MNSSSCVFIVIIVFSLILVSGCTFSSGTPVQASSTPSLLKSLILTLPDVPQNFTLVESRAKNSSEVGELARAVGWRNGCVMRFNRPSEGAHGPMEILQTITWCPKKSIPGIAELIEQQERSDSFMTFSNPSSPVFVSHSRAFSGAANLRVILKPETANIV